MKRFLFWTRVMAENAVLRHTWIALRELCCIPQSRVLRDLDAWIQQTNDPAAEPLRSAVTSATSTDVSYGDAVGYLYGEPEARRLLERWWAESLCPALPADKAAALSEIFRYDLITQPIYCPGETEDAADRRDLPVMRLNGDEYYRMADVALAYGVLGIISSLRAGGTPDLRPAPKKLDLYFKVGAENFIGSTNHEEIVHFMGTPEDEILMTADAPATGGPKLITNDKGISALLGDRGGCA
jgi:hypothetical protein